MSKAASIIEYFDQHPEASRKEVAEAVGCTVQRVGEVVRDGKVVNNKTMDKGASAPAGKATAELIDLWRTERCEHEKRAKSKLGSCKKGCAPVEVAS